MSVQSYIKFWTAEPSEHEEVQAYDLLGYEYDFRKQTTYSGQSNRKDIRRQNTGEYCRISNGGTLGMDVQFKNPEGRRGDEHFRPARYSQRDHPFQGSKMP